MDSRDGKRMLSILKWAVENSCSDHGLKMLIQNNRGPFAEQMIGALRKFGGGFSGRNQYREEDIYGYSRHDVIYSARHQGPKSPYDQVSILRGHFPQLTFPNMAVHWNAESSEQSNFCTLNPEFFKKIISSTKLPWGAEGWFAIPKWQCLAQSYGEATKQVLLRIEYERKSRQNGPFPFGNLTEHLDLERLKKGSSNRDCAWEDLERQQAGSDILLVPAQFGGRHLGRSARRARECLLTNEFGLDVFSVGCMLLTHPEIFDWENLILLCIGSRYSNCLKHRSHEIEEAPYFTRRDLDALPENWARNQMGAASAFLPLEWISE